MATNIYEINKALGSAGMTLTAGKAYTSGDSTIDLSAFVMVTGILKDSASATLTNCPCVLTQKTASGALTSSIVAESFSDDEGLYIFGITSFVTTYYYNVKTTTEA